MSGDSGLLLIHWIQSSVGAWLGPALLPLHYSGEIWFFFLALPLLYWCVDKRAGQRQAMLVVVGFWLASWLKASFDAPRPFEVSADVVAMVHAPGGSMPSGHALLSAVFWGGLAQGSRRAWAVWGAAGLSVAVGLSRVVHGVHFPVDVAAGWGLGLGLLWACESSGPAWGPRLARLSLARRLLCMAGASALALVLCPGLTGPGAHGGYQVPVTAAGILFGTGAGLAIEASCVGLLPSGPRGQRVRSYGLGIAVFVTTYAAGKYLAVRLAPEPGWAEATLRFARYALAGLVLAWGIPWLLVRIGWAEATRPRGGAAA